MDKDQEEQIKDILRKAGMTITEADEFIHDPQAMVDKMHRENMEMIVMKIKAMEQALSEQQQKIGELSAKVWRLEQR